MLIIRPPTHTEEINGWDMMTLSLSYSRYQANYTHSEGYLSQVVCLKENGRCGFVLNPTSQHVFLSHD